MSNQNIPRWPDGADKQRVRECNCEWCEVLEAIYLVEPRGVVPESREELQAGLEDFSERVSA